MSSGEVSGRQLVSRPPIVPSSLDKLRTDRFDSFHLFYEDQSEDFRYKLTVVDREVLPTTRILYAMAVFLIPAGREGEYMFSSEQGLRSILESSGSARLVAGRFPLSFEYSHETIFVTATAQPASDNTCAFLCFALFQSLLDDITVSKVNN
jgi:hypothetical protein